jgi:hypothetical protein
MDLQVVRASNVQYNATGERVESLIRVAQQETSDDELRQQLRDLVPDFHPHTVVSAADEFRATAVRRA